MSRLLPSDWKVQVDNKMRGAYGDTNYDKKVVRVSKKAHRPKSKGRRKTPNNDGSENLLMTIMHEMNHVRHPNMSEKGVEKLAKAMKSRMSDKQKAKYYNLV